MILGQGDVPFVLDEIYDIPLPKLRKEREKLYAPYIQLLLLEALEKVPNHILETTNKQILRVIGAVSPNYKTVPLQYYYDSFPLDVVKSGSELKKIQAIFYKEADRRLTRIMLGTIRDMEDKSLIKIDYNRVVVIGKRHILTCTDETGELDKMIMDAELYAFSKIQVSKVDPVTLKRYRASVESYSEVRYYHREEEYKSIYDKYIQEQYGWDYTYEQLRIIRTEKSAPLLKAVTEAKKQLNELIVPAMEKTFRTKLNNLELKRIQNRNQYSYPNPEHFMEVVSLMIDTEIGLSSEAKREYDKWREKREAQ